jgi:hypothetical protein
MAMELIARVKQADTYPQAMQYGIVRLKRGERGRIAPKLANVRVELDLPLTWSKDADRKREAV